MSTLTPQQSPRNNEELWSSVFLLAGPVLAFVLAILLIG